MKILIATSHVPFIRGGAEAHADELRQALRRAGHEAEIIAFPFSWQPPEKILDHMLACRLFDVTGATADLLIGLKFPAYLLAHPNKVIWLLHQHRVAYDLWEHPLNDLRPFPNGVQIRDAIRHADRHFIAQAKAVYANSQNVAQRLKSFCAIDAPPLYHPPPHAAQFYCAPAADYFLVPGRFEPIKRQALVLQALALTRQPVRLRLMGQAANTAYCDELLRLVREHNLQARVEWLGEVTAEEKVRLFAGALGIVFPPVDEDYGYVTLEAMLAAKPVVTCTDSGGPLEFVIPNETGYVVEPTPAALANALDQLWRDRAQAEAFGAAGRTHYESLDITWDSVLRTLLA